jgi:hypothetical protein
MKDSVLVNGVALTRKQIEEALQELNKPELLKLNISPSFEHMLPLSDGQTIMIIAGRSEGAFKGSLYLGYLPLGYQWALKQERGFTAARTLIIEPIP